MIKSDNAFSAKRASIVAIHGFSVKPDNFEIKIIFMQTAAQKRKPIVTSEDYINSLRGRELQVFLFGEPVEDIVEQPETNLNRQIVIICG